MLGCYARLVTHWLSCLHLTRWMQMSLADNKILTPHSRSACVQHTHACVPADLASKASEYTEDALAIAAVGGLAAAAYYAVTELKKQRNKEIEEAEALLQQQQQQQQQDLASRSPVRRVQRLVQRLKGNA